MEDKATLTECEIHAYAGKDTPKRFLNLIRSRWMRSYKHDNDFMRLVHPEAYYFAYSHYVDKVLSRPNTEVRFAVLADDNDVVLGFSVTEGTALHYVHVPKDYRRNGIAGALVPKKIEWITHLTKIGMRIWAEKLPDAKFNPFI